MNGDTKPVVSMTSPLVVWCRACGTHHDIHAKCKPPVLTPSERVFGVEMEASLTGSVVGKIRPPVTEAEVKAENERILKADGRLLAAFIPSDPVNHPPHYTKHPSGVECIQIVEHMGFCLGNAIKYLWRADEKGSPLEDLKKARFYIDREIQRREKLVGGK